METDRLTFLSSKTFKQLAERKADLANVAVMKSAPLIDVKVVDTKLRRVDFVISAATLDRDADIINVDGWDTKNFSKNPVVLFAHDGWQPPVARSVALGVQDGLLKSTAEFTPQELYPFGFMIFQFYAFGYMKATSVGFKPQEWSFAEDRKYGVNFQRQELLEYSCVPVPSNPDALVEARGKGIDTNPLKVWCEQLLDDARLLKDGGFSRPALERIRELASPNGKSLLLEISDLSERVHALPKETRMSEKAGRVLSAANTEKVKTAMEHTTECVTRAAQANEHFKALLEAKDDDEGKAGAALSQATKDKLKSAMEHVDATADRAKKASEVVKGLLTPPKDDEEPAEDGKEARELVERALAAAKSGHVGQVDAIVTDLKALLTTGRKDAEAASGKGVEAPARKFSEIPDDEQVDDALFKGLDADTLGSTIKTTLTSMISDAERTTSGKLD